MAGDGIDPEVIDRLIRKLTTPSQAPGPSSSGPARAGRWTNVRVVMPPRRAPTFRARLRKAADQISLPKIPDFKRYLPAPGPAAAIRTWVGLAVVYSVAITFWPYQKTVIGLGFYLLALGLLGVAGVWGARLSWDRRLGAAHTLAVATVFWSIALATVEAAQFI